MSSPLFLLFSFILNDFDRDLFAILIKFIDGILIVYISRSIGEMISFCLICFSANVSNKNKSSVCVLVPVK